MSLEAIAKSLIPIVAKALISKINSVFNPTDLEKALKAGISAAEKWDDTQPSHQHLFYHCTPKDARDFLERFFKDTGVQEELQKPLQDKTTPDTTFLIRAFTTISTENPILKFPENSIEPWLKEFVDAYFQSTSTFLKFQIAKQDYLKQLTYYFDDVKFAGIAVEGREIDKSAKLVDIFVMPDVVEELTNKNLPFFDYNEVRGVSERQVELIVEQQQRSKLPQDTSRKFPAQQLLSESKLKKFVLLGAPGSGKTTLMSYFAVTLAEQQIKNTRRLEIKPEFEGDLLPILIRIRDLARYTNISILQYLQQFTQNELSVKQLPPGFFEYWLEDGQTLILLDGLDEVADSAKRSDIVEKIGCFLRQFDRNRAIITSRPAGYRRNFFRTEEFSHYTLQFFDDEKIELFIQQWYESQCESLVEAQERKESLQKAFSQESRIKILAQNPLLLTIIALIHRYQARLPRQRYQLYDKAVKTLLINWDEEKYYYDEKRKRLEYLKPDDIPRLMEQLAYWIHTQGNTGDKDGGTLIDKDELITQLSKFIFEQQRNLQPHHTKAEAERFVEHIRERAGLLNEQGQDCYAFVHKTFQEYLASQEIWDRQQGDGDEVVLEHIEKYLHNPHWREVLLLLIAQQHRKKIPKFLKHILEQPTPYEQWLHRNLFFVGSCFNEDLDVADGNLVVDILQKLVNLEICDFRLVGKNIRFQVFNTLCSLSESKFEEQTLQMLKNAGERIDKERLLKYRVALEKKEQVIPDLLLRVGDQDSQVYYNAANTLVKFGKTSEEVVQGLLGLLADQDSNVRSRAANALRELGNTSEVVVQGLLRLLADQDFSVRMSSVYALVELGNTSEILVQALLALLTHQDFNARIGAANTLVKLGNTSEALVEALLSLLAAPDFRVNQVAANALADLGKTSKKVIQALLSRLANQNFMVRYAAGCALLTLSNTSEQTLLSDLADQHSILRVIAAYTSIELGKTSEGVQEVLLSLLADQDSIVRLGAAYGLSKLGNSSENVVQVLLSLLTDKDSIVRLGSACALSELGNTSEDVVEVLLLLLADQDSIVRVITVNALGKLGNTSEAVVQALLSLLADHNSSVRESAVNALGKLGNTSEVVVQALLSLLADQDLAMRECVVDALLKLGSTSEMVVQALLLLLADHDSSVRGSAANALTKLGNTSEMVIQALLSLLADHDSGVRWQVAYTLVKLGNTSEALVQALLSLLVDLGSSVSWVVADALGELGNTSEAVVQVLLSLLTDQDSAVRESTVYALRKLGNTSSDVTDAVVRWIEQHQDSEYIGSGIDTLWNLVEKPITSEFGFLERLFSRFIET